MINKTKSFEKGKPVLYLIATPIGNLGEFSLRAQQIVADADLVGAEDTRNSALLLKQFNITKPLVSLREHNERSESQAIVKQILEGKKVVYMSDAGYPGISDPGKILVEECIKNDIAVSAISGSSAFLNALVCSGIETNHFYFHGFLSSRPSEAKKEIESLKNKKETLIFYEAPHRIEQTLKLLNEVLGNREFALARELTKLNEEYIRGNLDEVSSIDYSLIKGELVIVISGNKLETNIKEEELIKAISLLLEKGVSKKDCVSLICEIFNQNKNYIYDLVNQK